MSKPTQLSPDEAWALRKEEKRKRKLEKESLKDGAANKDQAAESELKAVKKRKAEPLPEELEIDIDLPEPVSKKASRKAKKLKSTSAENDGEESATEAKSKSKSKPNEEDKKTEKRSEYGVWIGNLPWSATKDSLRTFLTEHTEIPGDQITRIHLPPPTKPPNPNWTFKPLNKGFAYVDFSTELAMYSAIALTETKMDRRPLLIKNAKNFEGRPDKPKGEDKAEDAKDAKSSKPPNKRIFVGNLAFEVTKEELQHHFGQFGDVADLHMATFEDSGKCKGYAWVTFETIESATSAVKGYIYKEDNNKKGGDGDSDEENEDAKSGAKKRKWKLNKLMGRDLRCEFAEDASTRYQKRYGKEKKEGMEGVHPDRARHFDREERNERPRPPKQQFQDQRPRKRVDPRTIKSGAAHSSAPRGPQGIVKSEGTKVTFD